MCRAAYVATASAGGDRCGTVVDDRPCHSGRAIAIGRRPPVTRPTLRAVQRRTAIATTVLFVALAVAGVLMLVPYTQGSSRQHSSALHYWFARCSQDDGEAWSERPFAEGEEARRDCRTGAVVRTAGAVGAVAVGIAVLGEVQILELRPRPEEPEAGRP